MPPFQQQQGFDYQPQHHNQQFIQQEQTYTLNQGVNQNNGQGFGNNEGLEPSFSSPLFQEPIITKHVYFHTAPEEDEQPQRVQIRQQIVSPQKHYKIIFIKAPSNGISQDIQVPAHPQVIKIFFNIRQKTNSIINTFNRQKKRQLSTF